MKKLPFLFISLLLTVVVSAQNVGIGTPTPANKLSVAGKVDISDSLGIGTTTPAAKLDVIGTIKVTDGSQATGKVLTSDANGLASWTYPTPAAFLFATDQSIGNGNYLGLGTSSATFIRNTIVAPYNCQLSSITFSIRTNTAGTGISATVWVNNIATPLQAIIANGITTLFATGTGSVFVLQGDLISIRINTGSGGALTNGAAVSVIYK